MHFKSLKVFCDVVGRRSFSRAADENGISQSGASQIVHHLEERLGVKLLDRSKRPFVLTDEGKLYYDGCRELVKQFDSLEERVQALHKQAATRVRIASIYSVGLSFMKEFVQDFSQRYPAAKVKVEYAHPNRIYELVREDQVDLGLVSYPRSSRQIEAVPWREEPMVLVTAPNHPLAQRENVRLNDLEGCDMVSFDNDLRIRREIDRVLTSNGVTVNVVLEFDNIETLKKAIEINSGVSVLPEPTVQQEIAAGTLAKARLEDLPMLRPVGIIHRHGVELSSTAACLMKHLQAVDYAAVQETSFDDARHSGESGVAGSPTYGDTPHGNINTSRPA